MALLEYSTPKFNKLELQNLKIDGHGKYFSWLFCYMVRCCFYTAIFISEVVRAGIMAVSKGHQKQVSLGLRRGAL